MGGTSKAIEPSPKLRKKRAEISQMKAFEQSIVFPCTLELLSKGFALVLILLPPLSYVCTILWDRL